MRVLVVDDDLSLTAVLARALRLAGFVVDVEHTGPAGLWAATENGYDVIVLDIMLPDLNGYDVLKGLREREVWAPVLMLTAKEFALLEYLMHRAGEVVTKTELLDHVWDPNFAGDVNVVEVYVGYLRRKLDREQAPGHIETVRGMGYRLLT